MLKCAFTFLLVAIGIAVALGLSGVAGSAVLIAWILFVVGLVGALVLDHLPVS
jgi:uncharacterized membrane protein YtjA (UPF0391 family)